MYVGVRPAPVPVPVGRPARTAAVASCALPRAAPTSLRRARGPRGDRRRLPALAPARLRATNVDDESTPDAPAPRRRSASARRGRRTGEQAEPAADDAAPPPIGQARALAALRGVLGGVDSSGGVLLFDGPPGVGRRTAARWFAVQVFGTAAATTERGAADADEARRLRFLPRAAQRPAASSTGATVSVDDIAAAAELLTLPSTTAAQAADARHGLRADARAIVVVDANAVASQTTLEALVDLATSGVFASASATSPSPSWLIILAGNARITLPRTIYHAPHIRHISFRPVSAHDCACAVAAQRPASRLTSSHRRRSPSLRPHTGEEALRDGPAARMPATYDGAQLHAEHPVIRTAHGVPAVALATLDAFDSLPARDATVRFLTRDVVDGAGAQRQSIFTAPPPPPQYAASSNYAGANGRREAGADASSTSVRRAQCVEDILAVGASIAAALCVAQTRALLRFCMRECWQRQTDDGPAAVPMIRSERHSGIAADTTCANDDADAAAISDDARASADNDGIAGTAAPLAAVESYPDDDAAGGDDDAGDAQAATHFMDDDALYRARADTDPSVRSLAARVGFYTVSDTAKRARTLSAAYEYAIRALEPASGVPADDDDDAGADDGADDRAAESTGSGNGVGTAPNAAVSVPRAPTRDGIAAAAAAGAGAGGEIRSRAQQRERAERARVRRERVETVLDVLMLRLAGFLSTSSAGDDLGGDNGGWLG